MSRKTFFDSLAAVLVIALALVVLNRAAVWWTVNRTARESGALLSHAAWGSTPYAWEMDDPSELMLRPSRGLKSLSVEDGSLTFEALDNDPYLYLDLGRLPVPAKRYPVFSAQWSYSEETYIQLHFWEPGNPEPRVSSPVTMPSGELAFQWDLRWVPFYRLEPGVGDPLPWGGERGIAHLFRVDFGDRPGVQVKIDRLALESVPENAPWLADLEMLRGMLEGGEEIPAVEAFQMASPDARPRAPWIRLLFTADSYPLSAPPGFDPHSEGTRCIGCFRWPLGIPADTAGSIARGWAGRVDFFEVHFPWSSPEHQIRWKKTWDEVAGVPLFPRKVKAKDIPLTAPKPLPGRAKQGASFGALRWGIFTWAVLFFALMGTLHMRGFGEGARGKEILEVLGVWATFQIVLAAFPRYDVRFFTVMWLAFGLVVLAVMKPGWREGGESGIAPGGERLSAGKALKAFGFSEPGHIQGAWTAAGATLAGLVGIWVVGASFGEFRFKPEILGAFPAYLGKAFVQQILLCPFLSRSIFRLVGRRRYVAAALAAVVFASIHLPNFTLTGSTLLMGFLWSSLFLKYGKLFPLILSHAVLGTCMGGFWGPPLLMSHRVGARMFLG
ncbi:MAG: CPBP family glutamic-type intramembrane protease [Planctomycetota bacterium]